MKMRKSILSLAVSLGAVSLLFAGNVFAEEGVGIAPSASAESDSVDPQFHVGTCIAKRASYATKFSNTSTASIAFIDVPEMIVSFNIPGAINSCLIVDTSFQAFAPGASVVMLARAVLDGFFVGQPGEFQIVGGATDVFSDSYNNQWVFPSVAPGFHTVKMQFRSNAGAFVHINRGTMIVNHK
jgi:hypothetical protein